MGHEGFSGTLSDDFIASICDEFDIPADRVGRFTSELNCICGRFLKRRDWVESLGSDSAQHKELQRIAKEVSNLSAFVETIREPYQQYLENTSYNLTENDYEIDCRSYETNNSALEPVEHGFRAYPDRNASFFKTQTLRKQLNFLVSAVSHIRDRELDQQKRGAKGNRNLDIWIEDISWLWRNLLIRKFKRDEIGGVGTTEASRFCAAIFAVLEPETDESTVINAMKKRITIMRKDPYWHE